MDAHEHGGVARLVRRAGRLAVRAEHEVGPVVEDRHVEARAAEVLVFAVVRRRDRNSTIAPRQSMNTCCLPEASVAVSRTFAPEGVLPGAGWLT